MIEIELQEATVEAVEIIEGNKSPAGSLQAVLDSVPRLRQMIAGSAITALAARKSMWSKEKDDWIFEPDGKCRLEACKFLASYADGLPTQTTVNLNLNKDAKDKKPVSDADLEEQLRRSPELRKQLASTLAKVETIAG